MRELPPRAIALAAKALQRGQVICLPTETSYGLAADIRSAEGLARLLELKGGGRRDPVALIAADRAQARTVVSCWPARAEALAERHWPGALTLVVAGRAGLPQAVVGADGTVGVRVSSYASARAIAAAVGAPITATSANPSGEMPAHSIERAEEYFGARVEIYLDAGPTSGQLPSTVVRVHDDGATTILRDGAVEIFDG